MRTQNAVNLRLRYPGLRTVTRGIALFEIHKYHLIIRVDTDTKL